MKIDIPSNAVRTGALLDLGVCARHGVPATRARSRKFSTDAPTAAVVFALFSLFVGLLIIAAFQKDVRGPVPECDRCATIYTRRVVRLWIGAIGGPSLVIIALFLGNGWVGLAGLVLFLLGIASGVAADLRRVRGTLGSDLAWVQLRGVDPTFATAVRERVKYAPQADPWVTPLT